MARVAARPAHNSLVSDKGASAVSPAELQAALHLGDVDVEELVELLTRHFGSSRWETPREIGFPSHGEEALTLGFSKDLKTMSQVKPGPLLDRPALDALSEKIASALISTTGPRVGAFVVIVGRPMLGVWRYQDHLQLGPVPAAAPRPEFLLADHPAVLQFPYRTSPEWEVNLRRRLAAGTRWGKRLNLLVRGNLDVADIRSRHHWVLVPDEGGRLQSRFLQAGYWLEDFLIDRDALSDEDVPQVPRIDAETYYGRIGTLDPATRDQFTLPEPIDGLVRSMEALPLVESLRLDRAAYWFHYATAVAGHYSGSAAAVALGATVEAMTEGEPPGARCEKCDKEIRGPTAKFVDFLAAHLVSDDAIAARRLYFEFYELRSRPAHGGLLDSDAVWPAFVPGSLEDSDRLRDLYRYVRLALVNWLLERAPGGGKIRAAT